MSRLCRVARLAAVPVAIAAAFLTMSGQAVDAKSQTLVRGGKTAVTQVSATRMATVMTAVDSNWT
ncbi:ribosomal protein S12 [Kitasatospora sp. GP82]|nr:ribosomal protein S12 [Kitasatospora sp. GP82]